MVDQTQWNVWGKDETIEERGGSGIANPSELGSEVIPE